MIAWHIQKLDATRPAADVGETVSVAASDLSTKFNSTNLMAQDGYYTFSNLGSCVDIFAPGGFMSTDFDMPSSTRRSMVPPPQSGAS